MTAHIWTRTKSSVYIGRRKSKVPVLISDSSPGIALQEGEWLDMENSKGKEQLDLKSGYRPVVIASGVLCGPVFGDLQKASDYAVSVSALTDWNTAGKTVSGPIYAKLMRLWYPAAGKKLTAAMRRELAKLEAEPQMIAGGAHP